MAPLYNILSRRDTTSTCNYNDDEDTCNTNRNVILAIILFVGALVAIILPLAYYRSRKWRAVQQQEQRQRRAHYATVARAQESVAAHNEAVASELSKQQHEFSWLELDTESPPPPYMPRAPENVARVGR